MEKLNVAIVGCGSISDIYMSNITSGKFQVLKLVACSDLNPAASQAKADYDDRKNYDARHGAHAENFIKNFSHDAHSLTPSWSQ